MVLVVRVPDIQKELQWPEEINGYKFTNSSNTRVYDINMQFQYT